MGRHSAPKKSVSSRRRRDPGRPVEVDRLYPTSTSAETPQQLDKRRSRPTPSVRAQRSQRRRRVLIGCAWAAALLIVVAVAATVIFLNNVANRMQSDTKGSPDVDTALEAPKPTQPGEPFYMVIMGVDNREGETVARSDTLIVARIDPEKKTSTLVSIPRDTRVEIPGHGTNKINAANALGGPALVIETVKQFTGLPISHYMEVDFSGFREIVDAMGGVTVNVREKIVDMKAADHVASAATINAGEQKLTGAQALTFVRSRDFPRGDFTRIENQQIFIKALLKQGLRFSNAFRFPSLLNAVADSVTTDMSLPELYSLANDMKGMDDTSLMTVTMPGEAKMVGRVSYVIADDAAFAAIIDRVSQGLTPEPGQDEAGAVPDPSTITVAVRNGAGLAGVAAEAASSLTSAGFVVGEVGNANQFVYDETLIVYEDDESLALAVQSALGTGKPVASRGMYTFGSDVLLVIGKDWKKPATSGSN